MKINSKIWQCQQIFILFSTPKKFTILLGIWVWIRWLPTSIIIVIHKSWIVFRPTWKIFIGLIIRIFIFQLIWLIIQSILTSTSSITMSKCCSFTSSMWSTIATTSTTTNSTMSNLSTVRLKFLLAIFAIFMWFFHTFRPVQCPPPPRCPPPVSCPP